MKMYGLQTINKKLIDCSMNQIDSQDFECNIDFDEIFEDISLKERSLISLVKLRECLDQ